MEMHGETVQFAIDGLSKEFIFGVSKAVSLKSRLKILLLLRRCETTGAEEVGRPGENYRGPGIRKGNRGPTTLSVIIVTCRQHKLNLSDRAQVTQHLTVRAGHIWFCSSLAHQ